MRNRKTPKIPVPRNSTVRYAPPRLRSRTILGGSSGCAARVSQSAKRISSTPPSARKPHVEGVLQLSSAALAKP